MQWTSPDPKGVGTTRTVRLDSATVFEHFLDQCQHRILVEMPLSQVGILPAADLELLCVLAGRGVEATNIDSNFEPL